jgi:hypothetical protein
VVAEHRIVLLTHVIDGIIDDSIKSNAKIEMCNCYKNYYTKTKNIGDYESKVYYLSNKILFKYNRKFSAKIFEMLIITQFKFIRTVADTRNSYSHYLPDNKKIDRLIDGGEMLIYFEIVMYTLRLEITEKLGINIEEDTVREYLYVLHDWIKDIKKRNKVEYKSKTYKIVEGIEEMKKIMRILQERVIE